MVFQDFNQGGFAVSTARMLVYAVLFASLVAAMGCKAAPGLEVPSVTFSSKVYSVPVSFKIGK